MSRRMSLARQCPECLKDFRPYHQEQVCCDRFCASRRRNRMYPQDMHEAHAVNRAKYAKSLASRLRGLTAGAIWRLAYNRGFSAAWAQKRRGTRAA